MKSTFCNLLGIALATWACGFSATAAAGADPGFVTCPSDGMQGPVAAPAPPVHFSPPPDGLAIYDSGGLSTLAPRGWNCAAIYGSSGVSLFVTPELRKPGVYIDEDVAIVGPAVVVHRISGGTSGRFQAAAIDAQVFPIAKSYVKSVESEGLSKPGDIPAGPTPTDKIQRLGPTVVEYETPAGRGGLGVAYPLHASAQPIRGAIVLLQKEEMDVVQIAVRLPPETTSLTAAVIQAFERNHGATFLPPSPN